MLAATGVGKGGPKVKSSIVQGPTAGPTNPLLKSNVPVSGPELSKRIQGISGKGISGQDISRNIGETTENPLASASIGKGLPISSKQQLKEAAEAQREVQRKKAETEEAIQNINLPANLAAQQQELEFQKNRLKSQGGLTPEAQAKAKAHLDEEERFREEQNAIMNQMFKNLKGGSKNKTLKKPQSIKIRLV